MVKPFITLWDEKPLRRSLELATLNEFRDDTSQTAVAKSDAVYLSAAVTYHRDVRGIMLPTTAPRCRSETELYFRGSFQFSVAKIQKKYHPSGNLKFHYLGRHFHSFKLCISMEKILSISLNLNLSEFSVNLRDSYWFKFRVYKKNKRQNISELGASNECRLWSAFRICGERERSPENSPLWKLYDHCQARINMHMHSCMCGWVNRVTSVQMNEARAGPGGAAAVLGTGSPPSLPLSLTRNLTGSHCDVLNFKWALRWMMVVLAQLLLPRRCHCYSPAARAAYPFRCFLSAATTGGLMLNCPQIHLRKRTRGFQTNQRYDTHFVCFQTMTSSELQSIHSTDTKTGIFI